MVKKSKHSVALAHELDALNRGGYVAAVERFLAGEVPRGETGALWSADVAIYLGKLENVERYMRLAPESELRTVLEAERLFAANAWSEADAVLEGLTSPRALLNRARVAFKVGAWDRCLELARDVERAAEEEGNRFLAGRARYLGAVALDETDHRSAALDLMRRAIENLRETENGRYLAYALNHLGWLVVEKHPGDAADLVGGARTIAEELNITTDVITFDNSLIHHGYRAGRYEDVVERAESLVVLAAKFEDAENECYGRTMWCVAALALGRVGAAKEAIASFPIAALPDSDSTRLKADLLRERVAARDYDREAPARIERIIAEDPRFCSSWQFALARLWLWDALAVVDPWQARARGVELAVDAQAECDWFVQAELRAIDQTARACRWTGTTWEFRAEVVPDGASADVALDILFNAARREVFDRAHRRADGCGIEIAKLTQWSSTQVSRLRERYKYPPASPGRRPRSAGDQGPKPRRNRIDRRKHDGL